MSRTGWGLTNFTRYASGLITATPLTMAAWFYPTAAANGAIMGLFTSGSAFNRNSFRLAIDTSPAVIALSADSTATANATSTASASLNAWNHGAAVFASATSRAAYLNGGNKGTETTSRIPSGIDRTSIGVGDGSSASTPFQATGMIAYPAIWNIALSDADVAALAAGADPRLIHPEALVAFWPLVGVNSPENSLISNTSVQTIQGSLTQSAQPLMFQAG